MFTPKVHVSIFPNKSYFQQLILLLCDVTCDFWEDVKTGLVVVASASGNVWSTEGMEPIRIMTAYALDITRSRSVRRQAYKKFRTVSNATYENTMYYAPFSTFMLVLMLTWIVESSFIRSKHYAEGMVSIVNSP